MKKPFWILLVIVVVAAIVYMNLAGRDASREMITDGDSFVSGDAANLKPDILTGTYGLGGVQWVFTQVSEGDGLSAPRTSMRIQPFGVTRPNGQKIEAATWRLGTYDGSCAEIVKPSDDLVAALGYAQCWWAGGGNQFRAVRDGNLVRVEVRDVDEMERAPSVFKQLVVIDLASITD